MRKDWADDYVCGHNNPHLHDTRRCILCGMYGGLYCDRSQDWWRLIVCVHCDGEFAETWDTLIATDEAPSPDPAARLIGLEVTRGPHEHDFDR